jgi:hypothetical protein
MDLMDRWCLGNREDRISLDEAGRFLGCGRKNGSGKDFAGLLLSDPESAKGYLRNDLLLTRAVGKRIGVIQ